jgi:hypothetical protein
MNRRTQYAAGPGLPQTADQRIRWLPFKNYADETIPPYACMEVGISSSVDDVVNGEHVYRAFKPDITSESAQNPATLMFNGATAVPKEASGRGTFDMPAMAIVQGDTLFQSHGLQQLGPRQDSWLLWPDGKAFCLMDLDRTEPLGKDTSDSTDEGEFKIAIVTRASDRPAYLFDLLASPPEDVEADAYLTTTAMLWSDPENSQDFYEAGTYFVTVDCTVGFATSDPPNNAALWLTTWINGVVTAVEGLRYPFKPTGVYETGSTIENVSFSGLVSVSAEDVAAGASLRVRNSSAYSIRVYIARVTWFRLGPAFSS